MLQCGGVSIFTTSMYHDIAGVLLAQLALSVRGDNIALDTDCDVVSRPTHQKSASLNSLSFNVSNKNFSCRIETARTSLLFKNVNLRIKTQNTGQLPHHYLHALHCTLFFFLF